jgi:hypothetical protein
MLEDDPDPQCSEGRWRTVVEFSLGGEAVRAHQAAAMIAEMLRSVHAPDPVLKEAEQAIIRRMDEWSRPADNQPPPSCTILVRSQSASRPGAPADAAGPETWNIERKGWGFFLTERMTSDSANGTQRLVLSLHLYQEG